MEKRLEKKQRSPREGRGGIDRRRSEQSRPRREHKPLPIIPVTDDSAPARWEKHLPQIESDGNIGNHVKDLLVLIAVHVENYYRDKMVTITEDMHPALMDHNVDSGCLADSIAALLPQTRTPTKLIKHCFARSIINHVSFESNIPDDSFLPRDFLALPRSIAQTNKRVRGYAERKTVFNPALSRWRQLSAYLRPDSSEDQAYVDERDKNITKVATALCTAFEPWATSSDSFDIRRTNLADVMKRAAEMGVLLFSQPSTFRYRWQVHNDRDKRSGRQRTVLLPGFAKVKDEKGEEIERPRELVKPFIDTIFG